jgi:alkylhydroperoxidase/carboxymuconolactone decarboxylase family protein YurZ
MPLSAADRALCDLFVDVCAGGVADVDASLDAALAVGTDAALIDETLLLGAPYGGVPRAILAFGAWRKRRGDPVAAPWTPADRARSGLKTFESVYGERTTRVLRELDLYHPDLRAAIVEDAYGRVLARPTMPPRLRELIAIPALIALDGPRQAVAHALGARRAGADVVEILEAAGRAQKRVERDRLSAALDLVREALARPS